jgi:Phage portal protein, SPP1 Gp6-like
VARPMNTASVKRLAHTYFPDFREQREEVLVYDSWNRGKQEASLYIPKHYNKNDEYDDLTSRSPTPWLQLAVTAVAQTAYMDGIHRKGSSEFVEVWDTFQQNRWDSRQGAVYRGALAHGLSFVSAIPGVIPLTGEKSAVLKGYSALTTAAWYEDPAGDEFPMFAIHAEETILDFGLPGHVVELIDNLATYRLTCKGDGENLDDWELITTEAHDLGVSPFVRYTNLTDLDGRHMGEIEPFIPLARRIDQDTFDRLIVQRFGAWKVRWITGLVTPANMTQAQAQADLMKMKVNDFLVGHSKDTRFGTLDETQLAGFISARDADLRDLSAVTQVPPYQFLGLTANMQAESLAAARASLHAKSVERKTGWGESTESLARLTAKIRGNQDEMRAYDLQVKWKDTEVRSLSQAADALGKLGTQVGVPQQMLFEMVPNWTDTDVQRALDFIEKGGFDALVDQFAQQMAGGGAENALLGGQQKVTVP